jgi:hypothetical protein
LYANEVSDASVDAAKIDPTGATTGQAMIYDGSNVVWGTPATGGVAWNLTGNAGTAAGTNFLGTTDDVALELKVNGVRAYRLEPASTPNVVGGHTANSVQSGAFGGTIAGGGSTGEPNTVSGQFATVGGGRGNAATATGAAVGGGTSNTSSGDITTVGGGDENTASGAAATISGGQGNTASGDGAVVGGGAVNQAQAAFATIGGGAPWNLSDPLNTNNRVTDDYGTIGGGGGNQAGDGAGTTGDMAYATVGGGGQNTSNAYAAVVGGGLQNTASEQYSTVDGGSNNVASGRHSVVGGGGGNQALSNYAIIGGGHENEASGYISTVGGGSENVASENGSTVGGGFRNTASDAEATVGGGMDNTASGYSSAVGGGTDNIARASFSTVGGGRQNTASGSGGATVSGGFANAAGGGYSAVPGGTRNRAAGYVSYGAGYQAKALHDGCFVWSDYSQTGLEDSLYTTAENQFLIRAAGGVGIGTNAPAAMLDVTGESTPSLPNLYLQQTSPGGYTRLRMRNTYSTDYWDIAAGPSATDRLNFFTRDHNVVTFWPHGIDFGGGNLITTSVGAVLTQGGAWQNNSARASKTDFERVDHREVLETLAVLPVTRWRYKVEPESVRHIGPVAEDFYEAFGLGTDEASIGTVDADGVALAAIQGLYELVQEQQVEIEALRNEIGEMKAELVSQ